MDKRKACTYAYNVHLFFKMDYSVPFEDSLLHLKYAVNICNQDNIIRITFFILFILLFSIVPSAMRCVHTNE